MIDVAATVALIGYYTLTLFVIPAALRLSRLTSPEVVRKLQHLGYGFSIFLLLELFSGPLPAIAAALLLTVIAYPALLILERTPWHSRLLVARAGGGSELRRQMLYIQATFSALILVFWSLLGDEMRRYAAVAAMTWTFGDAAAAFVGKTWGSRTIRHPWVEASKTAEGTSAMVAASVVATALTLWLYAEAPWGISVLISFIIAPACGAIELVSRRGADTLTVPLTAGAILLPLSLAIHQYGTA